MRKIIFLLATLATLALAGCGTVMTLATPTGGDPAKGIDTLNEDVEFLVHDGAYNDFEFVTYQRCAWIRGSISAAQITMGRTQRFDPRLLKACIALEGFYRDLQAGRGGYCQGPKPTEKYVAFYESKGYVGVAAIENAAWQCISSEKVVAGGGFRRLHYVGSNYSALCGTARNPPDNESHQGPVNNGGAGGCPDKYLQYIGSWVPTSYIWHYIFTGEQGRVQRCPVLSTSLRKHLQADYAQMLKDHPLN